MTFDRRFPPSESNSSPDGENAAPRRPSVGLPSDLARRTCAHLWDEIGRMENSAAASELAPSPFRSFSASKSSPGEESSPSVADLKLVPKFPVFKRSSNKTTPFILKRVSVSPELDRKPEPVHPTPAEIASLREPMPIVISPVSVHVPPRPTVISPVSVSARDGVFAVPAATPAVARSESVRPVPFVPPAPNLIAPAVSAAVPPFEPSVSPVVEPVASPAASVVLPSDAVPSPAAKLSAVNSRVSLEDINREFARSRIHAEKTRRRRFRSPLINGEIREELKDEYYWEILSEGEGTSPQSSKSGQNDPLKNLAPRRVYGFVGGSSPAEEGPSEPNLLTAILVEPVIFIGHTTLLALSPLRRLFGGHAPASPLSKGGSRPSARSVGKKDQIRTFDFFIALICGIAIAVLLVFPLLKTFSADIYRSIRLSNVRRLSNSVQVSDENTPLLQMILDSPGTLGEIDSHLVTRGGAYSGIGLPESDPNHSSTEMWQDGEPGDFDSAQWSGALLDQFEGPERESDRGGKQK